MYFFRERLGGGMVLFEIFQIKKPECFWGGGGGLGILNGGARWGGGGGGKGDQLLVQ